jgi:hypothetical protein
VRWGSKSRGAPLEPVERLWAEKGSREKPPECDLRWLVHTDAPRKERWLPRGASHSTGWCASCLAEAEQARKAEEGQLRQGLGAHAEVLGLAIDASTAGKIGERRDFVGKHAERRGVFLISEALASLHGLDCRRPRERPLNRLPIRTMARSRD